MKLYVFHYRDYDEGPFFREFSKKYGIEIIEGSLELKTKPYFRQYNNLVVGPMEITFERILAYPKED